VEHVLVPLFALFAIFIAPLWMILHYSTKRKMAQGLSSEDEKMLSELWQLANRMESRLNTLETILDSESPGWRDKV